MIRYFGSLILSLVLLGNVTAAERKLLSSEIVALLPTIVAVSEETRQTFSKSGATKYTNRGRDTYGTWRVDKDLYCSQWPPARSWACYSVMHNEAKQSLVWVDDHGHRTVNLLVKK